MIRRHDILSIIGLTAFLFGLLVWVYVVIIQLTHPTWLPGPFSHVNIFPFNWRLDNIGIAAFAISAVGFLVWQFELRMMSGKHSFLESFRTHLSQLLKRPQNLRSSNASCRRCGFPIDRASRFCSNCGVNFDALICPCGRVLSRDDKYCDRCGRKPELLT